MGFLDFVEQNHGVGLAPYGFGQLSAFVVAYISRRCSDESADGVFLLIFAHVDSGHHVFIVKQIFGEGFCQFCLADTGGAEEDERTDGATWIVEACA